MVVLVVDRLGQCGGRGPHAGETAAAAAATAADDSDADDDNEDDDEYHDKELSKFRHSKLSTGCLTMTRMTGSMDS